MSFLNEYKYFFFLKVLFVFFKHIPLRGIMKHNFFIALFIFFTFPLFSENLYEIKQWDISFNKTNECIEKLNSKNTIISKAYVKEHKILSHVLQINPEISGSIQVYKTTNNEREYLYIKNKLLCIKHIHKNLSKNDYQKIKNDLEKSYKIINKYNENDTIVEQLSKDGTKVMFESEDKNGIVNINIYLYPENIYANIIKIDILE